ncbi:phage tail protein I [Agrococcus sp. DT81.2]|uniref:phage tail protein I n=1 Tax=Agrococcus sp. DT81.2 TaxID=3393414 RepID=UPI003CE4DDE7
MYGDRGIALLADEDQWARCAHEQTVLLPGGGVGLDWTPQPMRPRWDAVDERCDPPRAAAAGCAAGLAHDRWCRAWRSHPLAGTVDVTTSADAPTTSCPGGLRHPTGVAVDGLDRLYVTEAAGRALMIADLWSGRVIRRVATRGRPVDVVAETGEPGAVVVTASPHRIVRIDGGSRPCARSEPLVAPCGHPDLAPARIALLSGRVVVLWRGDTAILADEAGRELLEEPSATDIAGTPQGLLVVARGPDESFHRFWERGGAFVDGEPVAAADYDGGAVTIDPRGRIVYTTPTGTRSTQGSTARHARRGVVTSYRLDSGTYRTRWGRIFVDACLPTGTGLVVRTLATDEDEVDDPLPAAEPARGALRPRLPEATPPLPPKGSMTDAPATRVVARAGPLTPGTSGSITMGSEWTTYETGVAAPPGRYLWVRLELTGTERTSPRVRAMRIERPGHALLSALPRMYSSDDAQGDFLHRYLAPAEGLLHDLDTAAAERRILVDPRTTPDEFLPWLATFAGVVLDLRWPDEARRALVAEAFALFARRGTAGMLERMLRLYLGRDARIVERWRLRGLGGAFLGFEPAGLYSPTVSGTARQFGMLGHFTIGGEVADSSSYSRLAHRFTVLIPGSLTAEQREVVSDLVLAHKPSHTLGEICEVGSGMPVGRLRLGLTAFVAPPPGRSTSVIGRARLGRGGTLGTRDTGSRLSETRLGAVRVG